VEQPDWAKKTFHVCLTQEQVHTSPDVDTEGRFRDNKMRDHYGWPAYWKGGELGRLPEIESSNRLICASKIPGK